MKNVILSNGTELKVNIKLKDYQEEAIKLGRELHLRTGQMGQIVRAYLKAKFPKDKTKRWIKTDSYSGGDSMTLNFDNMPEDRYKVISKEIESLFQGGDFNSMEDIYEMRSGRKGTIEGATSDFTFKYVFTSNKKPY